jgi:hypothetical protein
VKIGKLSREQVKANLNKAIDKECEKDTGNTDLLIMNLPRMLFRNEMNQSAEKQQARGAAGMMGMNDPAICDVDNDPGVVEPDEPRNGHLLFLSKSAKGTNLWMIVKVRKWFGWARSPCTQATVKWKWMGQERMAWLWMKQKMERIRWLTWRLRKMARKVWIWKWRASVNSLCAKELSKVEK